MDFDAFLEIIPQIKKISLPGQSAHEEMLPAGKTHFTDALKQSALPAKEAGVLMLLYPKMGKMHLALIVRGTYAGVHSGQIAFPGGRFEDFDLNFEQTALRETFEEIGILPDKIAVIKAFTPTYIAPSHFWVHPFLGIAQADLNFVLNAKEVAGIIEWPLLDLLNEDYLIHTTVATSYLKPLEVSAFKVQEHVVWGATALILNELKKTLKSILNI